MIFPSSHFSVVVVINDFHSLPCSRSWSLIESDILLLAQNEIQIELRVDGIVDVRVARQHQLFVGQNLRYCILIGITLHAQFHHSIPYHLRRSFVIWQHDAFVEHNAARLSAAVDFTCDFNDIKVRHSAGAVALEQRWIWLKLSVDVSGQLVAIWLWGCRVSFGRCLVTAWRCRLHGERWDAAGGWKNRRVERRCHAAVERVVSGTDKDVLIIIKLIYMENYLTYTKNCWYHRRIAIQRQSSSLMWSSRSSDVHYLSSLHRTHDWTAYDSALAVQSDMKLRAPLFHPVPAAMQTIDQKVDRPADDKNSQLPAAT